MRGVAVLGSTGTIGANTLELVRRFPERFRVTSLAAGKNIEKLREQIAEFKPSVVSVQLEADSNLLKKEFPHLQVCSGDEGVRECIHASGTDVVIVGIVGFAGLRPTLEAIRAGKYVGLANKESLVTAGSLLRGEIEKSQGTCIPVDSEHNAIFRLLEGRKREDIETIVLTASGGPLLRTPEVPLEKVTPDLAVKHPNWKMGPKISVDSATLMNKGLELIEAHFLFGFPEDKIEVWVHPQSIVHGALWFKDSSCIAQLTVPDMKSSIGFAMGFPEVLNAPIRKLGFSDMAKLEFFAPDCSRFPALNLARAALRMGQEGVIALNAANEVAVGAFLDRQLRFDGITAVVSEVLEQTPGHAIDSIESVFAADERSRALSEAVLREQQKHFSFN